MTSPAPLPETVDLAPVELAELLGLAPSDAPYLATAPFRVSRAWVEDWRTRMGARELGVADLCVVLCANKRTVFRYLDKAATPRLPSRLGVCPGAHRGRLVSPANLILWLRERSKMAGVVPSIGETAGQRSKRAQAAQARVAKLCGDGA